MGGMYRMITIGGREREVLFFSESCGDDKSHDCVIKQYLTSNPANRVDSIYLRSSDGSETTYVRDPEKDDEAVEPTPPDRAASRRTLFSNAQRSMNEGLDIADRLIIGLLAAVQTGPVANFKGDSGMIYVQCTADKTDRIKGLTLLNPDTNTEVDVSEPRILSSFQGKLRCE